MAVGFGSWFWQTQGPLETHGMADSPMAKPNPAKWSSSHRGSSQICSGYMAHRCRRKFIHKEIPTGGYQIPPFMETVFCVC